MSCSPPSSRASRRSSMAEISVTSAIASRHDEGAPCSSRSAFGAAMFDST
jgi:hypothetical protein